MTCATARKVHLEAGPNLIPLVDVVMVLFIFLIMVGSFGSAEHYLVSSLPITTNAPSGIHSSFDPMTQLDIRVDSQRNQDTFTATVGRVQTQDANSLRIQLQRMRDQFIANGTAVDHLQVVINPNHFSKYQTVISVYQAALEAGFTKVAFHAAH